jgi:hypothetical protein
LSTPGGQRAQLQNSWAGRDLCDGNEIGTGHLRLGSAEGGPSVSVDLRRPLAEVTDAAAMAEEAIRLALRECRGKPRRRRPRAGHSPPR